MSATLRDNLQMKRLGPYTAAEVGRLSFDTDTNIPCAKRGSMHEKSEDKTVDINMRTRFSVFAVALNATTTARWMNLKLKCLLSRPFVV